MRIARSRLWRAWALGFAAVLALSSCSSPGATTAPSSAGSSTAGSALPASALIDKIKKAGKLRVGYAPALPWLGQDPKTNEYFGPVTTIAKAIAQRLGVQLEVVPQGFDVIVAAIQSDKIDVAAAPLYATSARLAVIDMSPYTLGGFCYLAKKTNTKVNKLDDLNNEAVIMANFEGTGTAQETAKKYPKAKQLTRVAAAGEEANFLEVLSGKADVTPFDASLAEVYKADYPDLKVIPDDCIKNPDIPTPIAVGYPKGDAGFKSFMDSLLKEMQPQIDSEIAKYSDPQYLRPGK